MSTSVISSRSSFPVCKPTRKYTHEEHKTACLILKNFSDSHTDPPQEHVVTPFKETWYRLNNFYNAQHNQKPEHKLRLKIRAAIGNHRLSLGNIDSAEFADRFIDLLKKLMEYEKPPNPEEIKNHLFFSYLDNSYLDRSIATDFHIGSTNKDAFKVEFVSFLKLMLSYDIPPDPEKLQSHPFVALCTHNDQEVHSA